MTQGLVSIPRSTAFFASSPAAIISDGLDVFVQLVIAAIATDPSPSSAPLPCATANESEKLSGTRPSDTRSCGRRGPARLGSTWVRSKSIVSENTGASSSPVR